MLKPDRVGELARNWLNAKLDLDQDLDNFQGFLQRLAERLEKAAGA